MEIFEDGLGEGEGVGGVGFEGGEFANGIRLRNLV